MSHDTLVFSPHGLDMNPLVIPRETSSLLTVSRRGIRLKSARDYLGEGLIRN